MSTAPENHYDHHFVTIQDANKSAWTTQGTPRVEGTGLYTGYTFSGQEVFEELGSVVCSKLEFPSPENNVYKIALDRNRRVLDPVSGEMKDTMTLCNADQLQRYVTYLRTGQRNHLQSLRGELPRTY